MSILWLGGEDIDFPGASVITNASWYRSSFARCALYTPAGTTARSTTLASPVTSVWLSCRVYTNAPGFPYRIIGMVKASTASSGLYVGLSSASRSRIALHKYSGTTLTQLAAEAGDSLPNAILHKVDMQVISYGASATVNVYVDGALVINYSGDVSASGVTDLDCVGIATYNNDAGVSEVIVADEDTRLMSLVTLYPNAAGTTNQWTGAYSDIDEVTNSDADLVYTDDAGSKDFQANLSGMPTGIFAPRAARIAVRASSPAGSTATKLGLGVNHGGTVNSGALQSPGASWVTLERLMAQNPVTGADWTSSELEALQLNLRSGS